MKAVVKGLAGGRRGLCAATVVILTAGVIPGAHVGQRFSALGAPSAVCSPSTPFAPPQLARLNLSGTLLLDRLHGQAVVAAAASDLKGTAITLTALDATTGRVLRSRSVHAGPVMRPGETGSGFATALDATTQRLFVLYQSYRMGALPPTSLDVFDTHTLEPLRRVTVGSLALTPVVDERSGRVFVVNQQSGTASVLDAGSGKPIHTTVLARGDLGPTLVPQIDEVMGRVFIGVSSVQGQVIVLDAHSGGIVQRQSTGFSPRALTLDRRRGLIVLVGIGPNGAELQVRQERTLRLLHRITLIGTPTGVAASTTTARAFVTYSDTEKVSIIDLLGGALLRSEPVRLDYDLFGKHPHLELLQSGDLAPPVIDRIDEQRRWVVLQLPQRYTDDGAQQYTQQVTVLDSRTGTRVATLIAEGDWPTAVAIDDRLGRAFSDLQGGQIALHDISCLHSYYVLGDLG